MVKHIILWKLKKDLTEDEQIKIKNDIKTNLEALVDKIDGLEKMEIRIEKLPSSSADIMMDSEFESNEALEAYQNNPEHVFVADNFVRPNVAHRFSMDYEV